ncbi:MAG: tetratricopeptide repeat protein [Crocinitomicaceae bacterium]
MNKWIFYIIIFAFVACTAKKENETKKFEKVLPTLKGKEYLLDSLSKLLENTPNDVSLLTQRSQVLFQLGENAEGLSDISKAYRLDSSNIDMRLVHADFMILNNKLLEARNDFNYVISKNPSLTKSYLGLAKSYLIVGNFNKAFEYINEALKKDNYLKDAYLMKGFIYKSQGNWKLAISSYQTAVQIDPNCYEGFVALGSIYEIQEDTLAYQFYETALSIDSNGLDALYGKALYLQFHDRVPTAQGIYRKITSIDSTWTNAYYNQGWIKLVIQKDYDSAAQFFLRTLELSPKYADAWYNLGLCHEKRKSIDQARTCFQNTLRINPNYTQAKKELDALKY